MTIMEFLILNIYIRIYICIIYTHIYISIKKFIEGFRKRPEKSSKNENRDKEAGK